MARPASRFSRATFPRRYTLAPLPPQRQSAFLPLFPADAAPFALQHDDVIHLFSIPESLPLLVNILTALSRRRPDLILSTLPQTVDVICAMFSSLQNTQAFSRLLVALTQMRLKGHETSPLAKHTPAILVAYVRAAADLHSAFTPTTRRELESGLFALCNLATAGGRIEARGREGEGLGTPFGLGEGAGGEIELWADLWRSWSKSRYMGQG
ncbi:uncharacterized protein IL334_007795 [Kwoniella shivajii]|uniref:Nucleolar 27S pre-rRNA processing Urb2/Npa2 C-terminal domain-containing protein n=1 Tax=Kwoniella shivajii TaxID=564305 RepID=A0ABZ1D9N3_9TREE|nr:hypothetical protein IL334_007795 [Kwoniella shivajii]